MKEGSFINGFDIPIFRDVYTKTLNGKTLSVNLNWLNISSDGGEEWRAQIPYEEVSEWLNPCVSNKSIITASKNSNKFLLFNPYTFVEFFTTIILPGTGWKSIAAGYNNIVIANDYTVLCYTISEDDKFASCTTTDFTEASPYAIDKVKFINGQFIIFCKSAAYIAYPTSVSNDKWNGIDLTNGVIDSWEWSDIVVYKNNIIGLNSVTNQLIKISPDFNHTEVINLPPPADGEIWINLSCYDDKLLSVSGQAIGTDVLTTRSLSDWFLVKHFPEAEVKTVISADNSTIYTVNNKDCYIKAIKFKRSDADNKKELTNEN